MFSLHVERPSYVESSDSRAFPDPSKYKIITIRNLILIITRIIHVAVTLIILLILANQKCFFYVSALWKKYLVIFARKNFCIYIA